MSAKSLKIDNLDLDLKNPRITLASDQRDAMQKILNEQKVRLINLAESIAAKGFSPMDRCLVLRSNIRADKFIVLEGNRRLLAAKLLKNPALISTLERPDAFKKRLLKVSQGFDVKKVEPVDCYEVTDRNGDSAEAHLMLGTAKMGASDFAGASDEFAKAVALNSDLPEVHGLYAKALMLTGDSDLSRKEFMAELRVDPYNFDANLQLGALAKQEQNYEQAKKYFVRAQETRPGDPGVRYQLPCLPWIKARPKKRRKCWKLW